jgi:hypothetical protein
LKRDAGARRAHIGGQQLPFVRDAVGEAGGASKYNEVAVPILRRPFEQVFSPFKRNMTRCLTDSLFFGSSW